MRELSRVRVSSLFPTYWFKNKLSAFHLIEIDKAPVCSISLHCMRSMFIRIADELPPVHMKSTISQIKSASQAKLSASV
ncbi:d50aabc8-d1d8-44e9-acdf-4701fc208bce [Sclerotinia trifoliorum]|uniref:D50aabc8-d1d8-44e9-acdf-4701fc208bce n=1 Tax=Sclerotinia trifoliorum TaxID=28548 RepID=A0A8H2VMY6_9HELO|nr:d50aabc8-d1d8-44e9-acdf-4701fc208bce [Sclerotinia trifoliorum]